MQYFSYLGEIATDNWYSALCNMNMILFEYFTKITDSAKTQIVQFFRLAIKANVGKVMIELISQICDTSAFRLIMSS